MVEGGFVALLGIGRWGRNIFRNLLEMGVLRTVCDVDERVCEELRKNYPFLRCIPSFEEVLADSSLQALVIATPAATHYELAKKALLSGKDVFVEKPLSLSVKEGQDLVAIAREKGRILMVGHILHYQPAVKKLK